MAKRTRRKRPAYTAFLTRVRKHAALITGGTLLAIDPALGTGDSSPAYAYFEAGELVDCGLLVESARDAGSALRELVATLGDLHLDSVDVLVVEQLRGSKVHPHLHWVTGVLRYAVSCREFFEIPIPLWKAEAQLDPLYVKDDVEDAKKFGQKIIRIARAAA